MATLADYGPEVRAEVKQVREVVSNLHQQLIKWNLVVWTAGNVSQRLHTADLFVIKPSGLRYEYLTPSSMVVCDLDGNVVDGTEAPSSEHRFPRLHLPQHARRLRCRAHPLHLRHRLGCHWSEHPVRPDDDG